MRQLKLIFTLIVYTATSYAEVFNAPTGLNFGSNQPSWVDSVSSSGEMVRAVGSSSIVTSPEDAYAKALQDAIGSIANQLDVQVSDTLVKRSVKREVTHSNNNLTSSGRVGIDRTISLDTQLERTTKVSSSIAVLPLLRIIKKEIHHNTKYFVLVELSITELAEYLYQQLKTTQTALSNFALEQNCKTPQWYCWLKVKKFNQLIEDKVPYHHLATIISATSSSEATRLDEFMEGYQNSLQQFALVNQIQQRVAFQLNLTPSTQTLAENLTSDLKRHGLIATTSPITQNPTHNSSQQEHHGLTITMKDFTVSCQKDEEVYICQAKVDYRIHATNSQNQSLVIEDSQVVVKRSFDKNKVKQLATNEVITKFVAKVIIDLIMKLATN
ncbi:MAG: hypothetical protein QM538_05665 [Methylacidiphilales bacterium]|nr:hypothetical protein [Candidatus Methylacidiphilales bacterium]